MATENSPLLGSQLGESSRNGFQSLVPTIAGAMHQARSLDFHLLTVDEFCSSNALIDAPESHRYGFALAVLLSLRKSYLAQMTSSSDDWDHWSLLHAAEAQVTTLDSRISALWLTFLNECQEYAHLEELLWTRFPYDDHSSLEIRVVELLADEDVPKEILCNSAVMRSIESYWRNGAYYPEPPLSSFRQRLIRRWGYLTPRVSHFLCCLSQMATFVLLVHYILLPPLTDPLRLTGPAAHTPDRRDIVLMILCFGNMLQWSFRSFAFLIVLVSLVLSFLPAFHDSGIPFGLCLLAFFLLFVQLHYPASPSPIFIFSPKVALPLAIFLVRGFTHVLLPVLAFFLPAVLTAGLLLSLSMKEWVATFEFGGSPIFTPMITRETLLFLGGFTLVCFVASLVLVGSSPAPRRNSGQHWDRYGESVGIVARRLIIKTTVAHADAYIFPPPFNIFSIFRYVLGRWTVFSWIQNGVWVIVVFLSVPVSLLAWIFSRRRLGHYIRL